MSAEIVNLNRFRKQKTRADKRQASEQNRAKHGRTKGEKVVEKQRDAKKNKHLDDHKLDT